MKKIKKLLDLLLHLPPLHFLKLLLLPLSPPPPPPSFRRNNKVSLIIIRFNKRRQLALDHHSQIFLRKAILPVITFLAKVKTRILAFHLLIGILPKKILFSPILPKKILSSPILLKEILSSPILFREILFSQIL